MRIVQLTAENVKRVVAVEIWPKGDVQIVAGRNAQGKSSVLDAIWLALGGGAASKSTTVPIRDGAESAMVELDLGDLLVTRTWTAKGSHLKVEADGARFNSPQGVLDALVGRLSFDPLEFTRLSQRDQLAALLNLVDLGIDLPALALERQRLFDRRTEVGRGRKMLDGQLQGLGPVEDAPEAETSAAALIARTREVEAHIARNRAAQDRSDLAASWVVDAERGLQQAQERLDEAREARRTTSEALEQLTDPGDPKAIEAQLDGLEQENAAVRRNQDRRRVTFGREAVRAEYDDLTAKLTALDQRKADALAAAAFPVDGLGFDDQGVTYQGLPFAQASAAEQIRVSLAMAMALNPKLRVIRILDGSLLDAENLQMIEQMATENDFQVWIERVGDGDGVGVVIEDGRVKE